MGPVLAEVQYQILESFKTGGRMGLHNKTGFSPSTKNKVYVNFEY